MASRARSRLSASISSARPNSQMTTAASGHWPMTIAPIDGDRHEQRHRQTPRRAAPGSPCAACRGHPGRSPRRPSGRRAATARRGRRSRRSRSRRPARRRRPWSPSTRRGRPRVGASCAGVATSSARMPAPRIAAASGAGSASVWAIVMRRATRSNARSSTPASGSSTSRSSRSSVAQSSSATRYVVSTVPVRPHGDVARTVVAGSARVVVHVGMTGPRHLLII